MIAANIRDGYVPIVGIAVPVEIENVGITTEVVTISGAGFVFSATTVTLAPAEMKTIYVATTVGNNTLTVAGANTETILFAATSNPYSEVFGDASYIAIFELPGGAGEVIPTLDNINLLMRQGNYFRAAGDLKIWRPDVL